MQQFTRITRDPGMNRSKPQPKTPNSRTLLSLHSLNFDEVMTDVLKIKPEPKETKLNQVHRKPEKGTITEGLRKKKGGRPLVGGSGPKAVRSVPQSRAPNR